MNGFGNAVRRGSMVGLALVLLVGVAACGGSPAPSPPAERAPQVMGTETVGSRVRDLVVDSPALGQYVLVRLLLPRRFEAEPSCLSCPSVRIGRQPTILLACGSKMPPAGRRRRLITKSVEHSQDCG